MKLAVFDIDGVLLDVERGGFKYLALNIGKEKEVRAHHEEYERRKQKGPWGLPELAAMLKGQKYNTLRKIAKELVEENLMDGAEDTARELKGRGYSIALLSSNPIMITDVIKDLLGADFEHGNELEFKDGVCTGELLVQADRNTKAEALQAIIDEYELSPKDVFIIGDSITDLPMAKLGTFISFNSSKKEVDEAAKHVVKENDLRLILDYLP